MCSFQTIIQQVPLSLQLVTVKKTQKAVRSKLGFFLQVQAPLLCPIGRLDVGIPIKIMLMGVG